jgi:hypothetical protein
MGSVLDNMIAGALGLANSLRGTSVTYHRVIGGVDNSVVLTAICAPKAYEARDAEGIVVTSHCHDWLIMASSLVLGGAATVPQVGDTIVETRADGTVVTHKAMLLPGLNVYDSIVADCRYRVHMKIVSEVRP